MNYYLVTRFAVAVLILAILPSVRAQSNGVLREVFRDISGGTLAALTNSAKFIANEPDEETLLTSIFEAPTAAGFNYGQRLRALITAPVTGQYTFWIASDDASDLYLSTDASPANKIRIAYVTSWTASREWTKEPNQQSAPITLLAGQRHYIEALMIQGGGGDNLAVRWLRPDGVDEAPINLTNCVPYASQQSFVPIHRYSFANSAGAAPDGSVVIDSVGGANGMVRGDGATFSGTRVTIPGGGSGSAAYIDLPNGLFSNNSTNKGGSGQVTVEAFVKVTGNRDWGRIFDFGSSGGAELTGPGGSGDGERYIMLSSQIGTDVNNVRFEMAGASGFPNGQQFTFDFPTTFNQDVHFVMTWDEAAGDIRMYQNAVQVAQATRTAAMSDIQDVNAWLGRSNWTVDNTMQGEFDEFRIYDRVLSPEQVQASFGVGPDTDPVHIVIQPAHVAQIETRPVSFSTLAIGARPITYQWYKNDAPVPGEISTTYSIASVSISDNNARIYAVASNNVLGSPYTATSAVATLTVLSDVTQPGDPIVASSANTPGPEDVANAIDNQSTKYLNFDAVNTGFTVTPRVGLTVVQALALTSANDAPDRDPASFNLEGSNDGENFVLIASNGVPVFNARFERVVISFANYEPYQVYRLIFPLTAGPSTCCMQIAEVEFLGGVFDPPVITSQPSSQTVINGDDATFSVTATGIEPLVYQWRFNRVNLPNQTSASLTISNATPANQGNYSVVVAHSGGAVTSADAFLTVNPAVRRFVTAPLGPFGTWNVYEYIDVATPFWQAHQNAAGSQYNGLPGHLVSVSSKEEDLAVRRMALYGDFWVGLSDHPELGGVETGTDSELARWHGWLGDPGAIPEDLRPFVRPEGWVWTSGEPYTYQIWVPGEPNNGGVGEGAALKFGGGWFDVPIGAFDEPDPFNYSYLIEFETQSATPDPDLIQLAPLYPFAPLPGISGGPGYAGIQVFKNNLPIRNVEDVIQSISNEELLNPINDTAGSINFGDPGFGGGGLFPQGRLPFPGDTVGVNDDNFQVNIQGTFRVPPGQGGPWTFGVHSDDGFALKIDGVQFISASGNGFVDIMDRQTMAYPEPTPDSSTRGQVNLAQGDYSFTLTSFEFGGGAFLELYAAPGFHLDDADTTLWRLVGAPDSPLQFVSAGLPPVIVQEPADINVTQGGTATFSVGVTGANPLSYQWRFNGNSLEGETSESLSIFSAVPANEGGYSVVIANSAGSITSAVATLTLLVPPSISEQPASLTVTTGSDAVFSVSADGTAPLAYQWRFNGNDLSGQTDSSLTIFSAGPADAGDYDVIISNTAGSVTSVVARLTVVPAGCSPLSISVAGENVTLTWEGPCQLQSASTLSGAVNWSSVPGNSPLTLPASGGAQFFRTFDASCSPNIVGYVNLNLPSGYSLIANPLDGTDNHLSNILPAPPDGTVILRFDPNAQLHRAPINYVEGVGWISSNQTEDYTLNPGEGFLISNPGGPLVVTFVGEVPQGNLVNDLPVNTSYRSSIAPISGPISSALSFPVQDGDVVLLFNSASQTFQDPLTYFDGVGWVPFEPVLPVGGGFRLQRSSEGNWVQSFNPSDCLGPQVPFVVTSTDDSGPNTLRQAILNANEAPGLDTIVFGIPGEGPHTIAPASELPAITDPLVIDGYTQPGASPNEMSVGNNAVLLIELSGENAGTASGLNVFSSDCTIRGLVINRFSGHGIFVFDGQNNTLAGNFIGTDTTGTLNRSNALYGVFLVRAGGNVIGGATATDRNLISANGDTGIALFDLPGTANQILGNYIGVNAAGTTALGNGVFGIRIQGSSGNFVGGTGAGEGNLISGHSFGGVFVISGADNQILGNLIGTDASGTAAVPNFSGIGVQASTRTTIGGTSEGARNVISGNAGEGITFNLDAGPNVVEGNFIGTDKSGTNVLGNGNTGITILLSANTTIGGTAPGAGNLISGNESQGIQIIGVESSNNVVQGNFIGTDVTGTQRLGAQVNGVSLIDSPGNLVGGPASGAGNVISGNAYGVSMLVSNATGNVVQGNFIGTDVTGTAPIPNYVGVFLQQAARDNLIGGTGEDAGNTIAFNQWGVEVYEDIATGAVIGNRILRNSFFANSNAAINLSVGSFDNFRPNDSADADIGPNRLQNFPVLAQAVVENGSLMISYRVDSAPANSSYPLTIEFFATDGNSRQGRVYLGSDTYPAAQAGQPRLAGISVDESIRPGQQISATATDADGNTSEFALPLVVANPSCAALPEGLVTWRRAEGDANDAVSANHGALSNGVTFVSGRVGQAFSFDGDNDLVNVPFAPDLDLRNAITLEAWVNPAAYSAGGGGDAVIAGRPFGYQLNLLPDGRVIFAFPSGSVLVDHLAVSTVTIPLDTFTHLAGTYDSASGEIKVYVNGALDVTVPSSGLINSMDKPLQIGGFSDAGFTGGFLEGIVDEVSLYNRALTANEISAIYLAGSAGKCVPPILVLVNGVVPLDSAVTVTNSALVEMRTEFPGGSTFYTLDGTPPQNGFSYTGPFTVTASAILRAIAYSSDLSQFVESAPVTITVLVPPSISAQPASLTVTNGSDAGFSVSADGTAPLAYQWRFNGSNLEGETSESLTIVSAAPPDEGDYSVVIANSAGSITSAVATLTVLVPPTISAQPASLTVTNGSDAVFSVSADGTAPLAYQWRFNGSNLEGETSESLTIVSAAPLDEGDYSVVIANSAGSITSAVVTLTVLVPPTISAQPANLTVTNGSAAVFTVSADGTAPLAYQWRFDGNNLEGEMSASLTIFSAAPANEGNYTVVIANSAGSITSAVATLTVLVPPTISAQPSSQTVTNGSDAVFSVSATGTAPLAYQWRFNENELEGETSASLTIFSAAPLNEGNYTVVIANSAGSITSVVATLRVLVPPSISEQPASLTVTNGSDAEFSVSAEGTAPLAYQWRFNGNHLEGETSPSLTIVSAAPTNEGEYTVVVANSAGSVTSLVARLRVFEPITTLFNTGLDANHVALVDNSVDPNYSLIVNPDVVSSDAIVEDSTAFPIVDGPWLANTASSKWIGPRFDTTASAVGLYTYRTTFSLSDRDPSTVVIEGRWSVDNTGRDILVNGISTGNPQSPGFNAYTPFTISTSNAAFLPGLNTIDFVVENGGGWTGLRAEFTQSNARILPNIPPEITTQPISQIVIAGDDVTFSVSATGTDPLAYQWRFNGSSLSGQTDSSLTIFSAGPADAGDYDVIISNAAGSITSAVATLTVLVPPSISAQPQSQAVIDGNPAVFSVSADGTAPLAYQWRFNGNNLEGETSASFVIFSTAPANEGNYTVVIVNAAGSVTSAVATLTVLVPPSISAQPQSLAVINGGDAIFSVSADGTAPLAYQWRFNGNNLAGETSASLAIFSAALANEGNYTVVIANEAGSITSVVATLTVLVPPSISAQPASRTVTNGNNAVFSVSADGTAPLAYQWRFNGSNLEGETSAALAIFSAAPAHEGNYTVVIANEAGSITSVVATLTVLVPPSISAQPASRTVTNGNTATFNVSADGTAPLAYQWRFNGNNLEGEMSAALTIFSAVPANEGNYSVVIANSAGSTTSVVATLTVLVPPSISTQPSSQTVTNGNNAVFSVGADGTAPLAYQWRFNGNNLEGETSASLTIVSSAPANEGAYSVVIANSAGSITSVVATLIVLVPPSISAQPVSRTVTNGSNASFSVSADGTAPLAYQWRFNGNNLEGETSASLTIVSSAPANEGAYSVVIANSAGSITSVVATLIVLVPPSISAQPTSRTVTNGNNATFSVSADGTAPLAYQWRFNGNNLEGETSASLTIFGTAPANEGNYSVAIANAAGSITSVVATLSVLVPPSISAQPSSQTVTNGSNAVFTVSAAGTAPLAYQWRFNGNNLAGETSAALTIFSAAPDNGGGYDVVIANAAGSITSAVATLTVLVPPSISVQPSSQTVTNGSNAVFTVSATGTAPLAYQWRFNGNNLAGETSASLTIFSTAPANEGNYSVAIANAAGSITSAVVTLTVLVPPSISAQPSSQTVTNGSNAVFTVSAAGTAPLAYQWRFNGNNLAGETSASLTIFSAAPENEGGYDVVIANAAGSITSAVATLTIAAELAVLESYSLDLPAGYSLIANQLHQGNNLISAVLPNVPGGTMLFKWNGAIQAFIVETYQAGVGWAPGTATLAPGEGAFINLPAPQTLVFAGEVRPATLPLNLLAGLNLVSRQVPRPGTFEEITGLSPAEGVIVDQYRPATGDYRTQVFLDGAWRDRVPEAQVGEAVWVSQFMPPSITGQPAPQTNATPGSAVNFAVAVSGTPPLRYQWQRNGVSIADATNASYTINNAQILDSGIYTVAVQPSRLTPPTPQPGVPEDLPGTLVSAPAALRFVTTDFPFSDDFGARPVLTTNAATLTGNNAANSLEAGEPSIAGKPGGHSVWLAWMAPANGIVTFITLGSSFDTLLAAYTGNGFPGTEVASDDDGGPFLSSRLMFNATAGQIYNIAVDGFGGGAGNFVLSWNLEVTAEQVPALLTQPQNQLVSLNGAAQFSVEATGANLTYQWFRDGQAVSGATSSNLVINPVQNSHVGVYVVQVNSGARFVLSQSAQLQIVSAGEDEPLASDKFQDTVAAATNNNALVAFRGKAARKVVARGFSGTQIFSSVRSTKEADEPNHCGVRGGKSEWFSYQPTNHGTLKLDTDGSNFDTVLAVYVGPGESFLTLTNVACDNNGGTNGTASSVLFNVTANTIYYIAVDGVNNAGNGVAASGRIQLNYRLVLPLVLTSLGHSTSNNNGRIIFQISGTPGVPATVQSANSLSAPVWTSLFTNTMANGSFTYTNTNALSFPTRFFRAIHRF